MGAPIRYIVSRVICVARSAGYTPAPSGATRGLASGWTVQPAHRHKRGPHGVAPQGKVPAPKGKGGRTAPGRTDCAGIERRRGVTVQIRNQT